LYLRPCPRAHIRTRIHAHRVWCPRVRGFFCARCHLYLLALALGRPGGEVTVPKLAPCGPAAAGFACPARAGVASAGRGGHGERPSVSACACARGGVRERLSRGRKGRGAVFFVALCWSRRAAGAGGFRSRVICRDDGTNQSATRRRNVIMRGERAPSQPAG
jgi:hypothetical protein